MFSTFNQQPNVSNLPVSATAANPQYYCPGVPYQVPFKNAFPDIVNGLVIHVLQEQAGKNPLRTFLFNMASNNGYQNELYTMLVGSTLALAEAFEATTQGNTQEQLVLNAAGEVTSCACGMLATQYPALQQMMGQGIEVEINRLGQRHQQIAALVAQVQQQRNTQQPGFGFQQNHNQSPFAKNQFSQPQGANNWPQQQQQQQPQWGQQPPQPAANSNVNWGRYSNGPVQGPAAAPFNPNAGVFQGRVGLSAAPAIAAPKVEQAPAPDVNAFGSQWNGRSSNGWPARNASPAIVEEMFQDLGGGNMTTENAKQQAFARSVEAQQLAKPTPEPYEEPVATQSNPTAVLNEDQIDEERPYDLVVLANGTEIRPAHQSGWTRTWTIEEPWDQCFDPNTHMKFHVRTPQADGSFVVKEVVKLISPQEREQMEYLQHEIKRRNPYVLDPSKKVIPVDWEQVANLDAPQVERAEDGAETPVENPEVKIIADELEAHSFEEAEIHYLDTVIGLGSENFEGAVREYYYRDMKPVNVDGNMIGVMIELSKKQTLSAAAKFLREHQENEEITPRLYNILNKELTDRVNQALSINLGYGKRCLIEDFVIDIDDLGNALHEDAMGLLWALLNTERAADILNVATNILKGEDYWAYLAKLGKNLTKEHKADVMQILARYEMNSVTHVPWALDLYATAETQSLKASDNAAVHKAMVGLLSRTGKKSTKFSHHYIVDINSRVLEVIPGYLGSNSVLIRAAQL